MKKLMIMLAALTVGVAANAAAVNWGGYISNENDGAQTAQEGTIFNLIYLGTTDLSGSLSGLTYDKNTGLLGTGSGKDFKAADGQTLVGTHTMDASEAAAYQFMDTFERADSAGGVNGNYLMVMFDSTTPDYYWAGQYNVTGVTDITTAGTIEDYSWGVGIGTIKSVTDSSSVPEPTSGLLLLVGAGMLALRRKQK